MSFWCWVQEKFITAAAMLLNLGMKFACMKKKMDVSSVPPLLERDLLSQFPGGSKQQLPVSSLPPFFFQCCQIVWTKDKSKYKSILLPPKKES